MRHFCKDFGCGRKFCIMHKADHYYDWCYEENIVASACVDCAEKVKTELKKRVWIDVVVALIILLLVYTCAFGIHAIVKS